MTVMTQQTTAPAALSVQNETAVEELQNAFALSGPRLPYKPERTLPAWQVPEQIEVTKKPNAPNTIVMKKSMPERIYRGSKKADLFLLTQPLRESRPYGVSASVLDGNEGEDWVAMAGVSARTSIADLGKNKDDTQAPGADYGYISTGNLFYWLDEIEHLIGHASTSDHFIGDEKNNILIGYNASNSVMSTILTAHLEKEQLKVLQRELTQESNIQVARDYIYGHDGNDTLSGSTGFYAGGEGKDIYVVLPLTFAGPGDKFEINNTASSQIIETDEVYLPGLDLTQDVEIRLEGNHFVIIPKDLRMHQKVFFADFSRSGAYQHLKIKDKTGNVYLPSVNLEDPLPARLHRVNSLTGNHHLTDAPAALPSFPDENRLKSQVLITKNSDQRSVDDGAHRHITKEDSNHSEYSASFNERLNNLSDNTTGASDSGHETAGQDITGGSNNIASLAEMTSAWHPGDIAALAAEAMQATGNLIKSWQAFSWLVLPSS